MSKRVDPNVTDVNGNNVLHLMVIKDKMVPVWPDWAIYWTLGNFSKRNLLKSPTFFAIFVKVSKSLIFLVKSFWGNFNGHLMSFYWSRWMVLPSNLLYYPATYITQQPTILPSNLLYYPATFYITYYINLLYYPATYYTTQQPTICLSVVVTVLWLRTACLSHNRTTRVLTLKYRWLAQLNIDWMNLLPQTVCGLYP